jgi:pimeloyl-ACP methyl ester carboxylesterase
MARDLGCVADRVLEWTGAGAIALGVGHSFGGTLTMAAAAARPGRYERAILIDPVVLPRPALASQRGGGGENPMAERARKRRHHWVSRDEARRFFADKPLFAHWTDRALGIYVDEGLADVPDGVELKCPGRVEGAIFAGGADFDPYAVAEQAQLPIRVARATHGDFTREAYQELVAHLPRGELGEIEGGHLVVMERPAEVARAILEFAGAR